MNNITEESIVKVSHHGRITARSQDIVANALVVKVMATVKNYFAEQFPELYFKVREDGILIKARYRLIVRHKMFFHNAAETSLGRFQVKRLGIRGKKLLFTYVGDPAHRLRDWQSVEFAVTMAKILTQDQILKDLGASEEAGNRIEEFIRGHFSGELSL